MTNEAPLQHSLTAQEVLVPLALAEFRATTLEDRRAWACARELVSDLYGLPRAMCDQHGA
ncbi:MAG TPA: hypothetical protein VHC18_06660 [Amycolatopsis sp.]|nr:hypothetical protein [Amycolatopsis sp.]